MQDETHDGAALTEGDLSHDAKVVEALRKFLSGVEPNVDQIGINAPTYGWGTCGANGQWEYPVHPALVELRRDAKCAPRYHELIYAVARVHPGETRHQTALRYITEREMVGSHGNPASTAVASGSAQSEAP